MQSYNQFIKSNSKEILRIRIFQYQNQNYFKRIRIKIKFEIKTFLKKVKMRVSFKSKFKSNSVFQSKHIFKIKIYLKSI